MSDRDYEERPTGTLAHDGDMLHFAWLRLLVALRKNTPVIMAGMVVMVLPIAAGLFLLDIF